MKLSVKKGDNVLVITGKDAGKLVKFLKLIKKTAKLLFLKLTFNLITESLEVKTIRAE